MCILNLRIFYQMKILTHVRFKILTVEILLYLILKYLVVKLRRVQIKDLQINIYNGILATYVNIYTHYYFFFFCFSVLIIGSHLRYAS